MKNKSFKANDWLITPQAPNRNKAGYISDQSSVDHGYPPPLPAHSEDNSHSAYYSNAALKMNQQLSSRFEPTQFLVPEWKGDGLVTKEAVVIQKIVDRLWVDAQNQFKKFCDQTKSLKLLVFSEFQNYAKERELCFDNILGPSEFWLHFADKESPYFEDLNRFKDIYCFRAVCIYLLKVRFIINLSDTLDTVLTPNNLISPGAYLAQIFRKNSSTELVSEALQSNHYSWYRPSLQSQYLVESAASALANLSLTELMKVLTFRSKQIREKLCFEDEHFSHSLSHRSFGRFLIDSLIFLPRWLDSKVRNHRNRPEILSTKFIGGQLSSLSLSHWLAQEDYLNIPWDCIIAPDFIGSEHFSSGQYIKICHELQFITFLLQVAKKQGFEPIQFLCQTMKDKNSFATSNSQGQMSLLGAVDHTPASMLYHRIFIHLNNLPKNNAHHFLMSQINTEVPHLLPGGRLYVLSNQKLFVPSLSEKTDQILKKLKLEAFFNFEELKHRGEVAPYLYIFKLRLSEEEESEDQFALSGLTPVKKELFGNFNISGELSHFSHFARLSMSLSKFFEERSPHSTPYYQSDSQSGPTFEFYQDAIVDGKLVSSLPKQDGQITHPTYFKKLTKTCVPFDTFFYIESLAQTDKKTKPMAGEFLGLSSSNEERFPLVLIVDFSRPNDLRLELIFREAYAAKREAYGNAYFQYFGLLPKTAGLNIDIMRAYFHSAMGRQITGLSLDGGITKLKSKVRAMLLPKVFAGSSSWEGEREAPHFEILNHSIEELSARAPLELSQAFFADAHRLRENFSRNKLAGLKLLMDFASNLARAMERLGLSSAEGQAATIYQNSFVKEKLVKLPTYSLCPHHDDVYVQVLVDAPQALNAPLESIELKKDAVTAGESNTLNLRSKGMAVICLHGPQNLLDFTAFVLSRAQGIPLSKLLGQLRLPSERSLSIALGDFFELQREYRKVSDQCALLLKELLSGLVIES